MAHGQVQTTRLTEEAVKLDHEFTRIKSGRELANGTLLLVDDREKQILVADFGQNTVRRIGRNGAGPGEYREPGRVHCAPGDSSLIEDRQLARWLILKGETIVREEPVMPRFDYIPVLAGGDRFGRVLDIRPLRYGQSSGLPRLPIHSHAESLLVIVDNRGSARRDTLARIRGAFRGVKRIMKPIAPGRAPIPWIVNNPLDFEDQAILFCDGWIAIVRADPYTVEWYSRDGSRVVREALPFVRVVVDAREGAVATRTEHQDIFTPDELPAWPEFVPPSLTMPCSRWRMGDWLFAEQRRRAHLARSTILSIVGASSRSDWSYRKVRQLWLSASGTSISFELMSMVCRR